MSNDGIKYQIIVSERESWLADPYLPGNKYRKLIVANRYMLIYQVRANQVL